MPNIQFGLVIFTNMEKSLYKVIGVMSGTSLDGVDLALIEFKKNEDWEFKIQVAKTIPYPLEWKQKLAAAIGYSESKLTDLEDEYTSYLAGIIREFIQENSVENIDAVCSHGHTIKHEPQNNFTLQIGNLPRLAQLVGERIVCNFRVQDVKLGGQGAPLVPVGDEFLFSNYKYCLNLGGFANISSKKEGRRIAYDICPVNTVLNYYAERLGKEFDEDGAIAASGNFLPELYGELEKISFYHQPAPKSLGMEFVNSEILPVIRKYEYNIPSVLNTATSHFASQIAANLDNKENSEVLLTGGGAFNSFLVNQIREKTKNKIIIPSADIINYKEALIFGLLGVLRLRGEVNVFGSVTGASRDHSSGIILTP